MSLNMAEMREPELRGSPLDAIDRAMVARARDWQQALDGQRDYRDARGVVEPPASGESPESKIRKLRGG